MCRVLLLGAAMSFVHHPLVDDRKHLRRTSPSQVDVNAGPCTNVTKDINVFSHHQNITNFLTNVILITVFVLV